MKIQCYAFVISSNVYFSWGLVVRRIVTSLLRKELVTEPCPSLYIWCLTFCKKLCSILLDAHNIVCPHVSWFCTFSMPTSLFCWCVREEWSINMLHCSCCLYFSMQNYFFVGVSYGRMCSMECSVVADLRYITCRIFLGKWYGSGQISERVLNDFQHFLAWIAVNQSIQ